MAITRMGYIKDDKNKRQAIKRVLRYIANPNKSEGGLLVGTHNILIFKEDILEEAVNQMMKTKEVNGKVDGRILYHFKISFAKEDKVTPMMAMKIANEFCESYLKDYEAVYAVHTNTEHIHFHVVFNSVSFLTGYKYRYEKDDWKKDLQPLVNSICKKYGLSEIDVNKKSEKKDKGYGEWANEHQKKSGGMEYSYQRIRADIDFCIKKSNTYEEFIILMKSINYKIDDTKKHLRIFAPGRKNAVRSYILTPDKKTYTKENIKKMINGTFKASDKKEILERMFKDWNYFLDTKRIDIVTRKNKRNLPFLKYEEAIRLILENKLKSIDDVTEYEDYLEKADKELNIIKKYIKCNMDYFKVYCEDMNIIMDYIKHKKEINETYEIKHEMAILAFKRLTKRGVSPVKLYELNKRSENVNSYIDEFKKKLYVNKKIAQRIIKNEHDKKVPQK